MEKVDPKLLSISETGDVENLKDAFLDNENVDFTGEIAILSNNNGSTFEIE